MMKVFNYTIRYVLIICILLTYILEPMVVSAESKATTLAGLRQELSQLQQQKQANINKKKATESEIADKQNAVTQAYNDIESAKEDIEISKQQIEDSNKKIEELKEKNIELLDFYEVMNSKDSYMEYITGASSLTDLIMRMDAINTLMNYNQGNMTTLQDEIDKNKQLQIDLAEKQDQLQSNIVTYQSKIDSMQDDLASLLDISMDIDDQIKTQKDLISYYETLGCKETEDLDVCAQSANNASWLKPLNKGVITSLFGYRISPITGRSSFHNGIDIGGNAEGTSLYAVGSGTVVAIINKASCGGNQVYMNVKIANQPYTVMYAHMLTINVKVGQSVTGNTVIGTVGGGPQTWSWENCSTGAHVHFSVSKGFYSKYSTFIAGQINPPGFPGKGVWFRSRTQWFG
jgi:murein DD-endopeptidase MepM/ murein hydrolase activator NlpD